ncbi:MAG: serine/threonine-protein kinase [Polyangiaceae bacterium]|nr:serine/threonine-protein kinase [Polyangiaceae bacterium]
MSQSIPPAPDYLVGKYFDSEVSSGVRYRIDRVIGEGGMAVAYLGTRETHAGTTPVVIKVVRAHIVAAAGALASMVVQKEAVALGRLNERVPPTPFVVRLVDTGAAALHGPSRPKLPWLALEYIHGGVEGTTLVDRIQYSVKNTGYAFDPRRVAHLARCLAAGLSAIHDVGVIHRDLTPRNVLCCGFGSNEIFKISDFGIARPQGLNSTFGTGSTPGTPGYAPPEQIFPDVGPIGTHSDVFTLACLLYFVLTGESLFDDASPVAALLSIRRTERRSILEGRWLNPELRENVAACQGIDRVIARASAEDPRQRPSLAQELAAQLVPWLTERASPPAPSTRLKNSVFRTLPPGEVGQWHWTVRHPPGDDRVVRSAAWDADGHCLVTTTQGPAFWTGQTWVDQLPSDMQFPRGIRFTHRLSPGTWLVGGEEGTLAVCDTKGVHDKVTCPDKSAVFSHGTGLFADLLTAVCQKPGSPPTLWAMAARRWLKPLPLPGVAYVSTLLPLDDDRWVICGRLAEGGGFAAIYNPLHWGTTFLLTPKTRAFVAGCSEPARAEALVVGSDGVALRVQGEEAHSAVADGSPDLTASAMDVLNRQWVTSIGRIWVRDPATQYQWKPAWSDASLGVPFVSIMAEPGIVVAMTADGAIVEGRAA